MIGPSESIKRNIFHEKSLEQMIDQFHLKHRIHCNHNHNHSSYMNISNKAGFALKQSLIKTNFKSPPKKYTSSIADRTMEYIDQLERPTSPQTSKIQFDFDRSFSPKKQFNNNHNSNSYYNSNNMHSMKKSKIDKYETFTRICRKNDKIRTILIKERISPHKVNYNDYFCFQN